VRDSVKITIDILCSDRILLVKAESHKKKVIFVFFLMKVPKCTIQLWSSLSEILIKKLGHFYEKERKKIEQGISQKSYT